MLQVWVNIIVLNIMAVVFVCFKLLLYCIALFQRIQLILVVKPLLNRDFVPMIKLYPNYG